MAGPSASNGYVIVGLTVFNYTGAVVEYTIPTTGFYYVAAVGAQGGPGLAGGGYGAGVGGSVLLDAGTELDIVVGQAGMNNLINFFNGGGGGGSFVWDPTAIPGNRSVPEASTWAMPCCSASPALAVRAFGGAWRWPRRRPRLGVQSRHFAGAG